MPAKAIVSKGYLVRVALIAAACTFWGLWSAYDGFVKYPRINRTADAFDAYKEANPQTWEENWAEYAEQHGYPANNNEAGKRKSAFDMISQYVMMLVTLPIGLVMFYSMFAHIGRWIASDEQGLTDSRGASVAYEKITKLDKTRWKKCIAVVQYEKDGGEGRLLIDDWKYERQPAGEILLDVESRIDESKIVGDLSEAKKAEAEAAAVASSEQPTSPPESPESPESSETPANTP